MVEPRTLRTHPEHHSHTSFPVFTALGEAPKSPLEKFLSIFADVRAGEGVTVVLMAVNAVIVLGLYLLLKPAREALILAEQGAVTKSYAAAGQAALLFLAVPIYGWLGSKVNRLQLISITSGFFMLNLIAFWFFGLRGAREGVLFYIWLGIFNNFVVAQFWAFGNDIYTEGQGRRLFPFIGVGASTGAWLGAQSYSYMVKGRGGTPYDAMLIAAGLLLVTVGLIWIVNRREKRNAAPEVAKEAEEPLGREGGFQLILADRYLLWIAVLIFLLNIVNSTGEFVLGKLVTAEAERTLGAGPAAEAARKAFIGGFYGDFYSWTNLLGFLFQAFAVSRVMRYAGVRGALFFLPIVSLVSYSVLLVAPLLAVVRVVKILENATDYSLMNTVRPALWLPTTREAKYKAKAAVDTFVVRLGDMAQAGVVFVGTSAGLVMQGFALVNVVLTVAWLWVAWQLKTEHRRRTV